MANTLIYGLTDPRDGAVRYIGMTKVGLVRARQHGYPSAVRRKTHRACWIRELRAASLDFGFVILEEVGTADALPEAEQRWIAKARALGWKLTNHTEGGEGLISPDLATRERMAAAHRGKKSPKTPEWRAALSRAHKGKKISAASIAKRVAKLKGRPLSSAHCAALRAAWARRRSEGRATLSPERRAQISEVTKKQWERQPKDKPRRKGLWPTKHLLN